MKACPSTQKPIHNVHSSIIHYSQKGETSQLMSGYTKCLDHPYSGTLFNHEKEGNAAVWDNMDGNLEGIMLSEIDQRKTNIV